MIPVVLQQRIEEVGLLTGRVRTGYGTPVYSYLHGVRVGTLVLMHDGLES